MSQSSVGRQEAYAASHQLADELRRELLAGGFAQGTRLREQRLADRHGVGRYTVRAALRELVHCGLLIHESNRGVAVPKLSAAWIHELFDYRLVIELGSLRMALHNLADLTPVEEATEALEALGSCGTWEDATTAHRAIHQAIVDAAENVRLSKAYSSCVDELQFMLAFIQPDFSVAELAALHRRLLGELRAGEQAAVPALSHDIEITGRQSMLAALHRAAEASERAHP